MQLKIYFPRFRQYFAALTVSFGMFLTGTTAGWTGNNTDALLAGEYNSIPIDLADLGWITSLPTLAAMIVFLPIGIFCDVFGRKTTLLSVSVFAIIGWTLIIFAKSLTVLLIGRFVLGIGTGPCFLLIPLYNVEIAEKDIRAKLGSFSGLLFNCGILFSYVMGYVTYIRVFSIICATLAVMFFIALLFQDETPTYKIKRNDYDSAKNILQRLRKRSYNVDAEIEIIKRNLNEGNKYSLKEVLQRRSTKIATVVSGGIHLFQHLGGSSVIVFYTNEIFSSAQTSINPKHSTIILGALQVLTAMIGSSVVDFFRRRVLLITSFFFTSIGLIILGSYFTLKYRGLASNELLSTLGFIPLLGLTIFTLMCAIGVAPLSTIMSAELYPSEIKGLAMSVQGVFSWLIVFLISLFYTNLKTAVGGDVTFYIFAGMWFLGAIFTYLVVPETKNKTLEQIQNELNKVSNK